MLLKKCVISALLASTILFTGCASMFHGTTQQVAVRSNVDGAHLYVNEAYIGKGSGVTTFHKNQNYTITAKKEGCTASSIPAEKTFDPTTLLGIFLDWGIISILVIDGAATGASKQFTQTSYVIDPSC